MNVSSPEVVTLLNLARRIVKERKELPSYGYVGVASSIFQTIDELDKAVEGIEKTKPPSP